MTVELPELYRAYRAAKYEAFRDVNCAHGLKFAEFEADLTTNLKNLQKELNRPSPTWPRDFQFIGKVACIPKSIEPPKRNGNESEIHFQASDPSEQWRRDCAKDDATADFRPVIDASVEFSIISALWILRVGFDYDSKLDTRYAVGNRLRRLRPKKGLKSGTPGEPHPFAHGLFAPYHTAYGAWRAKGLRIMRDELENDHRIVAVTMDLKRFYHRIDASFMINSKYLKTIGLSLTGEQRQFTEYLIESFATWNTEAHKQFNGGELGLPVGLTASQVIANVLLQEFDRDVVRQLSPAYYSRYVDDVFLVVRHPDSFDSGNAFIKWLVQRLTPMAKLKTDTGDELSIQVALPYAKRSELLFVGKKQKIFQLAGSAGLDLIGPIEEQIREQTSEHRAMPDLPASENAMAHRALLVNSDASLSADALRKADAVTLRRSGFAMLLSDVEAYARDLTPETWRKPRHEFMQLVERQLRGPKSFFDYSRYIPRIVGVMVACGDYTGAQRLIEGIEQLFTCIQETSDTEKPIKFKDVFLLCRQTLGMRLEESVLQSAKKSVKPISDLLKSISTVFDFPLRGGMNDHSIKTSIQDLQLLDWARESYAKYWMDATEDEKGSKRPSTPSTNGVIDFEAIDQFTTGANLKKPHWPAVAFPTRPIPQRDITLRHYDSIGDGEKLNKIVCALRGSWLPQRSGIRIIDGDKNTPPNIVVPNKSTDKPKVAITSFEVTDKQWAASVTETPDLSLERYQRLNRMLDAVAKSHPRPDYVLFPECAIPQRWAMPIATNLLTRGISLIAGLEYRHDLASQKKLHNEVLVALQSNFPGYSTSLCIIQPKECAAWHEEAELRNRGKRLPIYSPKEKRHVVYDHGGFCFGVLICSELTNIRKRALFQGKVDALFIPEWNSDLESFGALIEVASLDVHCYVAQANNRKFGDSRMRAPLKKHFARDVIRLKGGENDYFVIGTIDYMKLRRFQSFAIPPMGDDVDFKPFPLGFPQRLSDRRRVVPA